MDAGLTTESIASDSSTQSRVPQTLFAGSGPALTETSASTGSPIARQHPRRPCFSGHVHDTPARQAIEAATCSALSATLAEPLPGTAAVAPSWLCLEQRGPWGHTALLESHLPTDLGRALSDRADASGVRVQLIRRPGRHPDNPTAPRRAYLAHTRPGASWLREITLADPTELLELDFSRIAQGVHDGWGQPVADPVLLICTNGRRDQCCAVRGRALTTEIGDRHRGHVWETTHTGGHRFAPAAVLLPSGYTYGRLDAHDAEAALSAASAGKVTVERCRGRSTWSRAGQAAELAVREHIGEYLADALAVDFDAIPATPSQTVDVRIAHRDGRRWKVVVGQRELEPPRANSCGTAAVRSLAFVVESVSPTL